MMRNLKAVCRRGLIACAALLVVAAVLAVPAVLLPGPAQAGGGVAGSAWQAGDDDAAPPLRATRRADFGGARASPAARELAHWVAAAADNGGAGFVIVDKREAVLHVFDADARLTASTAVLLGAALGSDSVPGIGLRPMASIQPAERTTPAGRFVGERGRNANGDDIVWVDYDAAVSMHRVRLHNPTEQRAQRLASPTADDNRISYGCINVPAAFYDRHIQPVFAARHALVYVLPDVKSAQEVFGSFAVSAQAFGRVPSTPPNEPNESVK